MKSILTTTIILSNVYHASGFMKPIPSKPLHLSSASSSSATTTTATPLDRNILLRATDDEFMNAVSSSAASSSSRPFGSSSNQNTKRDLVVRGVSSLDNDRVSEEAKTSTTDKTKKDTTDIDAEKDKNEEEDGGMNGVAKYLSEKMGTVDEKRLAFPEIVSGEVPRMFSNISYREQTEDDGRVKKLATHSAGSTIGAAALVAGTTIGAGILALPTATAPIGFLPSSGALGVAWFYMTISGLLIAELSINRMGETGKQGVGLLEIYKTYLGDNLGRLGSVAYFFLHYAIMVAYLSQGGANLGSFFDTVGLESLAAVPGLDQVLFTAAAGSLVYFASPTTVEKINNFLVISVVTTFVGIIGVGAGSADFNALVAGANQHPELVVNAFPILFLSMVFHNVVPTVVTQLEADRRKITEAIILGTSIPFVMFLAWNAVILGNVVSMPGALEDGISPVQLLQSEGIGGETLGNLVAAFSELAVTTSLIGFIYGLLDGLTDVTNLPTKGPTFEKWKPVLFAATLAPPLLLSLGNPDVFYDALDYGGAFGVSTLFLVLPPLMVWKVRYADPEKELSVPPMVPFGKIPLGSLWKAAGTLILEQGAEKLGVFDFIQKTFLD